MCSIKHDGRYKARLVTGGHVTDAEGYNRFSSTIPMEHLRLQVYIEAHSKDEMLSRDIESAYLNADTNEKSTQSLVKSPGQKQA